MARPTASVGPFCFLAKGVADENPVRRAQPRSGMPGRAAPIPPSPPDSQAFVESPSRDLRMPFQGDWKAESFALPVRGC
jgi:hypothetical protein